MVSKRYWYSVIYGKKNLRFCNMLSCCLVV